MYLNMHDKCNVSHDFLFLPSTYYYVWFLKSTKERKQC